MLKLIAGNVAFALIVWGWYAACGGAAWPFGSGVVAIFLGFVSGTALGVWLSQKPVETKPPYSPKPSPKLDDGVFDRIS